MLKKSLFIISILGLLSPLSHAGFKLAYDGYNAYSMSFGAVTQATPEHFLVVDERVFYFINETTLERFERNLEENIKSADEFFDALER